MAVVINRHQVMERFQCGRAGKTDFSHVGHVEQACRPAHGHVFLDDAVRILDGEQITGKGDDLAAFRDVHVVKRGFLFHGPSPRKRE